ncbi:TetR/AcrR family transcriptional regulator [Oerskovia sp. M15]
MPPPPAARAKVLEAFATLLVTHGERAATLDAVATEAGVSKGGLLYHFGSKVALAEGLMEHLRELTAADVEAMRGPRRPVDYFIRTSADSDSDFELVYVAVSRLAQGSHPRRARPSTTRTTRGPEQSSKPSTTRSWPARSCSSATVSTPRRASTSRAAPRRRAPTRCAERRSTSFSR